MRHISAWSFNFPKWSLGIEKQSINNQSLKYHTIKSTFPNNLLREAPIPSGSFKGPVSVCPYVRTYVRPRFRWFLRRVQAAGTGSYPPRQFFRNLSTVYFSNPHKQRLANDGSIFWDPFLDPYFEQKSENFTKKYPNILVQKMIKMIEKCASRHLPCRVLSSY